MVFMIFSKHQDIEHVASRMKWFKQFPLYLSFVVRIRRSLAFSSPVSEILQSLCLLEVAMQLWDHVLGLGWFLDPRMLLGFSLVQSNYYSQIKTGFR
jgi:hypothetical protein